MNWITRNVPAVFMILLAAGCASGPPEQSLPAGSRDTASAPATSPSTDPAWAEISKVIGQPGVLKEDVYTITIPRDDLDVEIEGMAVPMSAGLESVFWFYRCPCGKMNVVGQFITADYEAGDVVDALRGGQMKVAGLGPVLLYEKPRLLMIRFQAEGDATSMAEILKDALGWTGKQRMAPRKLD